MISNVESAEMIKYASNGFLATKISFINELAELCERVGADVAVVARGMGLDHHIGPKFLQPGPGFGGSCFPKDTLAVAQIAEEHGMRFELIDAVLSVNERIKRRMIPKIEAGINQTYRKTRVRFDRVYRESETFLLGRAEILAGLERGVFSRVPDGSVWVDLTDQGLDRKVLLRSDGTSLYVTQDVGTAVQRHRDWPFDRQIDVVGNEQRYHFQVLFKVLQLLGHAWAADLHHLAYGMVNLPEGRMKSREGTVVDADDIVADLEKLAAAEIREKQREAEIEDLAGTAEAIALGALNYYLLAPSSYKDTSRSPSVPPRR